MIEAGIPVYGIPAFLLPSCCLLFKQWPLMRLFWPYSAFACRVIGRYRAGLETLGKASGGRKRAGKRKAVTVSR